MILLDFFFENNVDMGNDKLLTICLVTLGICNQADAMDNIAERQLANTKETQFEDLSEKPISQARPAVEHVFQEKKSWYQRNVADRAKNLLEQGKDGVSGLIG